MKIFQKIKNLPKSQIEEMSSLLEKGPSMSFFGNEYILMRTASEVFVFFFVCFSNFFLHVAGRQWTEEKVKNVLLMLKVLTKTVFTFKVKMTIL